VAAALRLAGSLGAFWYLRGHLSEGRDRLERALAGGGGIAGDVRAKALFWAGWLAIYRADNAHAVARLAESRALHQELGDRPGSIAALIGLGGAAEFRGDEAEAVARYEEALGDARNLGDRRLVAWCLVNLADGAFRRG
jgi:hypothetical protein